VRLLGGFADSKRDLLRFIETIERHGSRTLLYNALYDSIEQLEKQASERKSIIVFTDGKDEGSSIRQDDVIDLAKRSKIPLHFISVQSSGYRDGLARMARLTGGSLVCSDRHDDVVRMYRGVLSAIKNTYRIEYTTQSKQDDREHRVEVRLNYRDVRDRDFVSVTFHRDWLSIPNFHRDALFIILSALFLLALALVVLYFINREKKILARKYASEYRVDNLRSRFEKAPAAVKEEAPPVDEKPTILAGDSEYSYASAWLVQKDGPESGTKFPLFWDEATLGRNRDNSLVIDDETVSPRHARIKVIKNSYYLFDLVSENGTHLNGKKLLRPRVLNDWDEIRIGRTLFIFRGSKRAAPV
jgi:hypothetical protein